MIINRLKYLLALLFVSFSTLASMAQEYERQEIKILDFKEVSNFHIDYAKEFAYQESNRDSTIWALLIVETNDPNIRVISSESNPGHYVWEELRKNPRFNINEHRMPGEIWYSLREGAQKFRVCHNLFRHGDVQVLTNSKGEHIGRIKDNWYIPPAKMLGEYGMVESGKTYRLKIEVPQYNPGPISEPKRKEAGYAVFKTDPEGASVYMTIDGKTEYIGDCNPDATSKRLTYGIYQFRIEKGMYHTYEGSVKIDSAKVFQNIKLRPNFGKIKISTTPPGAQVKIDNHAKTYITPCETDNITSGNYVVKLILDGHDLIQRNVIVSDGETTELNESFNPQYAQVTVRTIPGATITINGETKGTTSFFGRLNYNIYDIEVSKVGYENAFRQIEINTSTPQEITLYPTPIYGMVDISTQPSGANITIDGKNFGTSPNYIDTLLVGNHIIKISLDGYNEITRNITIKKDEEIKLAEKLTKTSVPNNDHIIAPIASKNQGVTNSNKTLTPKWAPEVTEEQKRILTELIESMVLVEGGTFTMGATFEQGGDAERDEKPTHRVTLSDYYIGKYEVTQEQWQAVMGSNPSYYKGSRKPVEQVSWNDCQEFIKKLNSLTGLKFVLPTEAQWEYAARGDNKSRGYKYSGSNSIGSVAYFNQSSGGPTTVGSKQANELGLYDMSGNVWEWCQDWKGSYSSHSQTNPMGPSTGSRRVSRGGSWYGNVRYCRVSYRSNGTPDYNEDNLGLRLAINLDENLNVRNKEIVSIPSTLSPNWSSSATAEQKRILGELIESMVLVEGDTFMMGAQASDPEGQNYDPDAEDWESPVHQVTLSDYYIGKYEVTQEQWKAVMRSGPSYSGIPVEKSWNDCLEFITKLKELTGINFTLPTEAQWEYAARGGNKSRGYIYSGSNNINKVKIDTYTVYPGQVGLLKSNELGLYDMSGNVSEWCLDYYSDYNNIAVTNPTGPTTGSKRISRGGSRSSSAKNCRVSSRFDYDPSSHSNGLRLVVNPK